MKKHTSKVFCTGGIKWVDTSAGLCEASAMFLVFCSETKNR